MEDFGPEIELFATGTYTVTRRASTSYIDGRAVAAANETFTIRAMEAPMSGQLLARLPEGLRGKETRLIFTTTELRSFGAGEPDRVEIDGLSFQVQLVDPWKKLGNFVRAVLVRADL